MEYTDPFLAQSGHLQVGDGHSLYFEDWGNRRATPIFHLHGGPGAGFNERAKLLYNPERHRVIFHDQRGSGRSLPFAETTHNTTQDLIADIERLREHLNIESMYVAGGSWGSSLTLLYALTHPKRVKRMVIWSIFLCTQFETDIINEGYAQPFFPEAWERFISLVPEESQQTGDDIMQFYANKINSSDNSVAERFADEWTLWEASLLSITYDKRSLEKEVVGDPNNLAIARLETHYLSQGCFVEEGYILDNLDKISSIPCSIIQGRFDFCTPPITAYELAKTYGPQASLQMVNAGHKRSDPEMQAALQATINTFFV